MCFEKVVFFIENIPYYCFFFDIPIDCKEDFNNTYTRYVYSFISSKKPIFVSFQMCL